MCIVRATRLSYSFSSSSSPLRVFPSVGWCPCSSIVVVLPPVSVPSSSLPSSSSTSPCRVVTRVCRPRVWRVCLHPYASDWERPPSHDWSRMDRDSTRRTLIYSSIIGRIIEPLECSLLTSSSISYWHYTSTGSCQRNGALRRSGISVLRCVSGVPRSLMPQALTGRR